MTTSPKYGFTGRFRAKPGQADALTAILLEASRGVAEAKGVQLYAVARDPKDDNLIHVLEIWDSKEDHDQSLALPGTREMINRAIPLIDGKPEGTTLQVLGGLGVK
jgi:quinol monooxygenase YgiN